MLAAATTSLVAGGVLAQPGQVSVRIYSGGCHDHGDLVVRLMDTSPQDPADDAVPSEVRSVVSALAAPVEASRTTVNVAFSDIAAQGHAFVVQGRADDPAFLACGELSDFQPRSADVRVGLGAHAGSGVAGVAWLHDNGDGTRTVSVVISSPAVTVPPATTADAVPVAIRAFFCVPAPLEISPGTTVTVG